VPPHHRVIPPAMCDEYHTWQVIMCL